MFYCIERTRKEAEQILKEGEIPTTPILKERFEIGDTVCLKDTEKGDTAYFDIIYIGDKITLLNRTSTGGTFPRE